MKKRRPSGFTLVELIVVIGIIAVLIGILLPTVVRVRRQANTTHCLNNQRQLILATIAYTVDHNDMLPGTGGWGSKTSWAYDQTLAAFPMTWTVADVEHGQLWPYLHNRAVYHCPQDLGPWPAGSVNNLFSYLIYGAACGYAGMGANGLSIHMFHPNDVLFWEILPYDPSANGDNDSTNYPSEGVTVRHKHGTTVSHIDGHVDLMMAEEFDALCQYGPTVLWCNPKSADGGYAAGYHHSPVKTQED